MSVGKGRLRWFSPDPRGILPLDTFHVPHGTRRRLRKNPFTMRINSDFERVIKGCADRDTTWIDEDIIRSYRILHQHGWAHSVETWLDDTLVGGLYGVSIGGAFFGESMFSYVTDASKVALVFLVERLRERRFQLLDTQWITSHLETFGACNISRNEYMRRLEGALAVQTSFVDVPATDVDLLAKLV